VKCVSGHVDEAHSDLDQPPRHQRAGAKQRAAIAITQGRRFFIQIEGVAHGARGQKLEGTLLLAVEARRRGSRFQAASLGIELLEQAAAMLETIQRQIGRQRAIEQMRLAADDLWLTGQACLTRIEERLAFGE
jgi:hypothetical protein